MRLDERILYVRRSHARATVKGGKAVALPIPTPLVPYLQDALDGHASDFVFPGESGEQLPVHTPMEKVFRRILTRAGLIVGWKHTCRRCVAKGVEAATELHTDSTIRACPRCEARMWPSAIPRQMRFHDCRHTAITLLLQLGVPAQFVQRIARHANIRTTLDTYGHLNVDDLRGPLEALGKATAAVKPKALPLVRKAAAGTKQVQAGSILGPSEAGGAVGTKDEGPGAEVQPLGTRALQFGAEHRVRTDDLRLGKATLYQLS